MKIFFLLFALCCAVESAHAAESKARIYHFKMKSIDGKERSLEDFRGKALLIVNTASKCGYTPQYKGLEELYERYKAKGFEVLGFPANNFMGQEPGTNEEIQKFCSLKYDVSFPLFSKISVKGKDIDPLYKYLTEETGFNGSISWNFNKFLVSPDGEVIARFDTKTDPLSKDIIQKIETALSKT